MLMQNVDLTWAQDPGAVTELLSGDFYVPMGRSTSHQLWSSAMVLTPTLRGLFGINLDAATNTITVNPHLPAKWTQAEVKNIHLGSKLFNLSFSRNKSSLRVQAFGSDYKPTTVNLRSDLAGSESVAKPTLNAAEVSIPLPLVELILPEHVLPVPGSRPSQSKVVSDEYDSHHRTLILEGPPNSDAHLAVHRNKLLTPKLDRSGYENPPGSREDLNFSSKASQDVGTDISLDLHFPPGQGWQTLTVTLTW
jgi:hypothetical protein